MPDGSTARTHFVPNDEGETGGEMEERVWIRINTFIEAYSYSVGKMQETRIKKKLKLFV